MKHAERVRDAYNKLLKSLNREVSTGGTHMLERINAIEVVLEDILLEMSEEQGIAEVDPVCIP